jgi:Spy/CpxP family protein refolding chaperone
MRNVCTKIVTVGLVLLAASPAFAQPRPGGRPGGGFPAPGAAQLLGMEKVQEELKLTDDQKAQITKITEKYKEDMAKARADMNREKMGELRKAESEEIEKAVPTVLKAAQVKRLKQLEVQIGGLRALSKDDVQASLKLTDAQKKSIKDSTEELAKDREEMIQAAGGDRTKMGEIFTKIQAMQKEAMEKTVNGLTDDQKKEWKELNGAKFDFPTPQRGPRPGAAPEKPKSEK